MSRNSQNSASLISIHDFISFHLYPYFYLSVLSSFLYPFLSSLMIKNSFHVLDTLLSSICVFLHFPYLSNIYSSTFSFIRKGKAVPVTDRGGPLGCEMLRLPHFLDNQFTDDGDLVSLTRRLLFNPGRFLVLISFRGWVDPGPYSAVGRIRQLKNTMTSSGIEPAIFRFVALCRNQLRYCLLPLHSYVLYLILSIFLLNCFYILAVSSSPFFSLFIPFVTLFHFLFSPPHSLVRFVLSPSFFHTYLSHQSSSLMTKVMCRILATALQ
jgi:hypothetical protein